MDFRTVLCIISTVALLLASQSSRAATEFSLGGNATAGSSRSVSSTLRVTGENLSLSGRYDYARANGTVGADRGYLTFGFDQDFRPGPWSIWSYVQPGFNHVRRIKAEVFAGTGPKYTFLGGSGKEISLSSGILHHWQGGRQDMRLSIRPRARVGAISLTAFYQPNVNNRLDYIAIGELSVRYGIAEHAELRYNVHDEYRSVSVSQGEKNELIQSVMMTVRL